MNHNDSEKLKTAIYLRLSDEDQNKLDKTSDSESIKNQRNLLLAEINKQTNFVYVGEYCDEDLSGAGTYRPEFERLIKDCENGKIDVILCKSQSRFSRDMEIIEKYLHNKFVEWNIRFIGIADNTDTANSGNKKTRQINGLVNEWFLEDVSNNIKSAFLAKMKQGEFISPFAPYGYEISKDNNNELIIDNDAALIVKDIFNQYIKGKGYKAIANNLNNNNIPSPSYYKYLKGIKLHINSSKSREDIKWSSNAVKKILTNEIYLGNLLQGKRTTISYKNHKIKNNNYNNWIKVLNTHEKIIDTKTFNQVSALIKKRSRSSKKDGKKHLFSGKVYCQECNHLMRKKNSGKHDYLVCSNNLYCSNSSSIRYDDLEKIILQKINVLIKDNYDINDLKKYVSPSSFWKGQKNVLESEKKITINELNKIKKCLKKIYKDQIDQLITDNQFKYLLEMYSNDEKKYTNKLEKINTDFSLYERKLKDNYNDNIFKKYQKLNKLDYFIINEFIHTIHIDTLNKNSLSRNITITWNF